MKRLLVALFALLVTGCSAPALPDSVAQSLGGLHTATNTAPRCAELFVDALTSPDRVVHGAVGCLSSAFKQHEDAAMASHGLNNDEDFQWYAQQPPVVHKDKYCGTYPKYQGTYYWLVSAAIAGQTYHGRLYVLLVNGKVANFQVTNERSC